MYNQYILDIIYLIGSVTFIFGLKMLSHPETARRGNLIAAAGMLLAIIGTIVLHEHSELTAAKIGLIIGGLAIGTIIG